MSTSNPKKVRNPEQTRSDLLAAAYAEILETGYQAASLDRILAKTSVSKGALYHHFGTKQDLGLAVVEDVIAPQLAQRWYHPLEATRDPVETLLQILEEKIGAADESLIRLGCPLNNLIQEMSPLDEAFRHRLQRILDEWMIFIARALSRGQLEGTVKPQIHTQDAALFIVAAIEGCVGLGKNAQSVQSYQNCLRQLQAFIATLSQQN